MASTSEVVRRYFDALGAHEAIRRCHADPVMGAVVAELRRSAAAPA